MIRELGDHAGFYSLPRLGEVVSGDDCFMREEPGGFTLAILDGAGHGSSARAVVDRARSILSSLPDCVTPTQALRELHQGLKGTPGASVAIVSLVAKERHWEGSYCAVGDIGIVVSGHRFKHLPVTDGVVGYAVHSSTAMPLRLEHGERLILVSDGINPGFEEGLESHQLTPDSLEIARSVVLDFKRDYDDASCLVFRS